MVRHSLYIYGMRENKTLKAADKIRERAMQLRNVQVVKQGFRNFVAVDENGKDVENTRSYCAHLARIKFVENLKKS